MIHFRLKAGSQHPDYPAGDGDDHEQADVGGLIGTVLEVEGHNQEEGDKEDKEEDIKERENMILAVELTGRHQNQPLETDDKLDQDTEEEEENLVHGGEVDTGV